MRPRRLATLVVLLLVVLVAVAWLAARHADHDDGGVAIAAGDGGGLPRAAVADEHVSASVLEALREAARQHGIDSLLVARHGHLLFEDYATPEARQRLWQGGALSAALLAQLGDERPAEPSALAAAIAAQLWQPLNAQPARLVDGEVRARAEDWLRVGMLLLGDGDFEGNQVTSSARLGDVRYEAARPAGEPPAARDLRELRGPGNARLWLSHSLQLALWHGGGDLGGQDTLLANLLVRAIEDRPGNDAAHAGLGQLVPGH